MATWQDSSQQVEVWGRGGGVKNARPEETAGEVDDRLDVLSVCLQVGRDWSLLRRDSALLWLAVDGRDALLPAIAVRLHQDKHVLPVRVDDGLRGNGESEGGCGL